MVGIFGNPLVPRNMFVLPWSISTSDSLVGLGMVETGGCFFCMKIWSFLDTIQQIKCSGVVCFFLGKFQDIRLRFKSDCT